MPEISITTRAAVVYSEVKALACTISNFNAFAKRLFRSIKEECLGRMILIGEGSFRRAVDQFCEHYHLERNHQEWGTRLLPLSSHRRVKERFNVASGLEDCFATSTGTQREFVTIQVSDSAG
ncbi:MAG: hypothetical protein ACI9R3_005638 [Verrucomicrobiales bacterium]